MCEILLELLLEMFYNNSDHIVFGPIEQKLLFHSILTYIYKESKEIMFYFNGSAPHMFIF